MRAHRIHFCCLQKSMARFLLTSRGDHVIAKSGVHALAKLSMNGGYPNYQPTRFNDISNFFRPVTKNYTFFTPFYFLFKFAKSRTTLLNIIGCFLDGQIVLVRPHITFSILSVALNNCLYIIAYLMTCVNLPRTRGRLTRYGLVYNTCNFANSVTVS